MLLDEANNSQDGAFKEFQLNSKDELKEFEIGSWLHDCGKVTTPEYVIDKSTKLETIHNRIHEIRTRFEVLYRDETIKYLQNLLDNKDEKSALENLHQNQKRLLEEFEFIANANIGNEFMSDEDINKIKAIASQEWLRHFDNKLGLGEIELHRYEDSGTNSVPTTEKLLSDERYHIVTRENFNYDEYRKDGFKLDVPNYLYNYGELYNLCIQKGTLSVSNIFLYYLRGEKGTSAEPQVSPPPKASKSINSPAFKLPCS